MFRASANRDVASAAPRHTLPRRLCLNEASAAPSHGGLRNCRSRGSVLNTARPPDVVDRGEYQEDDAHDRDQPPHHRGGNPFHDVRPRALAPHDRQQPHDRRGAEHDHGTDASRGAIGNRRHQVLRALEPARSPGLIARHVQIEQHHHTGLGTEPRRSNDPHPHRDAHVVVEPK